MEGSVKTRNLTSALLELGLDRKKMVFLSGPRQCGKTTLGKSLLIDPKFYFNWDSVNFKKTWAQGSESFTLSLLEADHPRILLDEFHKNLKWKNQLKGFFDTYGDKIEIILTGSAKLNTFRKGADSLMGRFLHFNLHPFSLGELCSKAPLSFDDFLSFLSVPESSSKKKELQDNQNLLFKFGGFPEPLNSQREDIHRIWSQNRLELLIRQDLKELSNILNIGQVEILASFLPERVGAPLSVQSLREDLDVAHTTLSRWLNALANVYYHFELKPYSKSVPRSLKKEGKIYLYDWSLVEQEGARFENMLASHLLKLIQFYNDTGQAQLGLHYLRNKDKQEVDFLVTQKNRPLFTVESKLNELSLSKDFLKFQKFLKVPHFQITSKPGVLRQYKSESAYVISFASFFGQTP
jgi:predicted AAA+ superfamily ATPase